MSLSARAILKFVFLNLFIFFLILASIEAAVRIIFPEIIPLGVSKNLFEDHRFGPSMGNKPNNEASAFGAKVITDGNGFRIDPDQKPVNAAKVIVVLGDSVSFGCGVAASAAFPAIIQRCLKNYRIINASVIGHSIDDYYNVLSFLIDKKEHFEGVLVSICLNDFVKVSQAKIKDHLQRQEELQREEKYRSKRFGGGFFPVVRNFSDKYINFNSFLREYSRTFLLVKSIIMDVKKNYFLADATFYESPDINKVIAEELGKINDLARRHNKWVVFIVNPYGYQLRPSSFNEAAVNKPQEIIKEAAARENLALIDLLPVFTASMEKSGEKADSFYLFGDPMHFSPLGHRVAGQAVCKYLAGQRID